jgi:hypothetical protein
MSPSPTLPDLAICKTEYAFSGYWSCLVNNAHLCPKKFNFGHNQLCSHDNSSAFDSEPDKRKDDHNRGTVEAQGIPGGTALTTG